ncbi:hypothetical protein LP419_16860 [Massilia sp. H-1]|nr:hypothetical protein LP419_16860 [Massilia sp. H-1]
MQNGADIIERLLRGAMKRRALLWGAVVLPWMLLPSLAGVAAALAWVSWDFWRLRQRVARDWSRWLDGTVPVLEDSSALLLHADTAIGRLQQQRLVQRAAAALSPDVIASVARERVRFDWLPLAASVLLAAGVFVALHTGASPVPVPSVRARGRSGASGQA